MVVNKLVWAPRIHGLFARYEIIDLISIIMFSDCYQMPTRNYYPTLLYYFNIFFFAVGFLCSVSSMCLEPCILGQRVTAPFWRLWRVAPIAWLKTTKKTRRRKTGLAFFPTFNHPKNWENGHGMCLPLRPGGRGAGKIIPMGGGIAASCL